MPKQIAKNPMKKLRGFKVSDLQKVVDKLKVELKFITPDKELRAAFAETIGFAPTTEILREVRKMLSAERAAQMQTLCVKIGSKFDYPPKPRDLIVILETAGYKFSRAFQEALLKMIHEQNAARWADVVVGKYRTKLTLLEGDKALWDALQHSYNMNADALASMLLRIFAFATKTGKLDFLEVPFLASTLSDREVKVFANSLNFTVKRSRKSRV